MKNNWKEKIGPFIFGSIIFIITAIIIIGVPIAINEAYKKGEGYLTMWNASDTLSYYANVLTFTGTTILGIAVMYQNNMMNKNQKIHTSRSTLRFSKLYIKKDSDIENRKPDMMSKKSMEHPEKVATRDIILSFTSEGIVVPNSIKLHSMTITNYKGEKLIEFLEIPSDKIRGLRQYILGDKTNFVSKFIFQYCEEEFSGIIENIEGILVKIRVEYFNVFGIKTQGEYLSSFPRENWEKEGDWNSDMILVNYEKYFINKNIVEEI